MHWGRQNVNPMLGLRNIVCSHRWAQEWQVIVDQLRRQAKLRRKDRWEKRRLAKIPRLPEDCSLRLDDTEIILPVDLPKTGEKSKISATRKPAADHPWRHSPIGRARYQPSKNAKI